MLICGRICVQAESAAAAVEKERTDAAELRKYRKSLAFKVSALPMLCSKKSTHLCGLSDPCLSV